MDSEMKSPVLDRCVLGRLDLGNARRPKPQTHPRKGISQLGLWMHVLFPCSSCIGVQGLGQLLSKTPVSKGGHPG